MFYVDSRYGVDGLGFGLFDEPFATIAYALQQCQPGDVIILKGVR